LSSESMGRRDVPGRSSDERSLGARVRLRGLTLLWRRTADNEFRKEQSHGDESLRKRVPVVAIQTKVAVEQCALRTAYQIVAAAIACHRGRIQKGDAQAVSEVEDTGMVVNRRRPVVHDGHELLGHAVIAGDAAD